jgi:hypothetical protein
MKAEAFTIFEIRKDSAVHVSLSSSLLVKQPGTLRPLSHDGSRPPETLSTRSSKPSLDDK